MLARPLWLHTGFITPSTISPSGFASWPLVSLDKTCGDPTQNSSFGSTWFNTLSPLTDKICRLLTVPCPQRCPESRITSVLQVLSHRENWYHCVSSCPETCQGILLLSFWFFFIITKLPKASGMGCDSLGSVAHIPVASSLLKTDLFCQTCLHLVTD